MSEQCGICGDSRPNSMEEHHIIPRRYGGGDGPGNMVVLCASCHRAVERIYNNEVWSGVGLIPSTGSAKEFTEKVLTSIEANEPIPKADLYEEYVMWCEQVDITPATQHKFTRTLSGYDYIECGRAYVDGEQRRCIHGVRLPR